jgi:LPS O-antigen subunit length determinant protein (WzzB/FepE family)
MAAPQNFVSVSRRPPDVEDYIDILRRYRSWIIGPTFAGLVIAVVVSFFMPDVYVCTAAMQIRPSTVSNQLMPSALNNQMSQRLAELDLQILGRDNLITLIQMPKLNLYQKERQRYSVEDVAEDIFRKHVKIEPYASSGSGGAQAFRIIFEYPDKNVARAVVAELVSEFDSKNIIFQTESATSASSLFDDLLKNATEKMEAKERALAAFVSENQGRLQENFGSNMQEVANYRMQIDNLNTAISQEKQKQMSLESDLNHNKQNQTEVEAGLYTTVNTPNQQVRQSTLVNIEHDIANKKSECAGLDKKYMPQFPAVQECHEQERSLEAEYDKQQKAEPAPVAQAGTSRVVTNPDALKQLNALRALEQDITTKIDASAMQVQNLEKSIAEKSRSMKEVQDRISASPQVIQTYNQLYSDYTMAKDEYTNVSIKKNAAGTQQTMEEHRTGERLEILENPITPEKAASPVRGAWVAIGTMVGLMFGIALAGAKEVKNTSLKNLKDVRAYTNLPVLSSIPLLENALLVRRKRRLAWLAWSSALIVGTVLMSGAMYYHYVIVPQA